MKYKIPTYEDCKLIVNTLGELMFYETVFNDIDTDFSIHLFNYRLATYNSFISPIEGSDIDARELRGICFIKSKNDNSVVSHFLMLNKFWNINQVTETQLPLLLNKSIKSVYNKMDGSLLGFIKLPNGKIISKTKMCFNNDQTLEVDVLTESNPSILKFVNDCFEKDLVTMWEYTSFKNRIVLEYDKSNLTLLRVRNNKTGEYVDIEQFRGLGFDVVIPVEFSDLENLIKIIEESVGVEGCVITFENDFMVKLKSAWYFTKHRLLENVEKENMIIDMILNNTIDDVISQLDPVLDINKIEWIRNIENIVKSYIVVKSKEVEDLYSKYDGVIRDFAIEYNKHENFSFVMNKIRGKNTFDIVKDYVLKTTFRLEMARTFIRKYSNL